MPSRVWFPKRGGGYCGVDVWSRQVSRLDVSHAAVSQSKSCSSSVLLGKHEEEGKYCRDGLPGLTGNC